MPNKRIWVTLLLAIIILLALGVLQITLSEVPFKQQIQNSLSGLMISAMGIIGLCILIFLVEPILERFIKGGFQLFTNSMTTAISGCLDALTRALAEEVGRLPESWKSLVDTKAMEDLADTVKHPELKELIKLGKIEEAVEKLDKLYKQQPTLKEDIAVLILSKKEKDWDKALAILDEQQLGESKYHITLANRYWSVKQIDRAIAVAEKGLDLSLELNQDGSMVAKFKNSLAYYYAETANPEYEELARQYANDACEARPTEPKPLDTRGYVLIVYGKTREEILEGVDLCHQALSMGLSFAFYTKNVTRASERLKNLP